MLPLYTKSFPRAATELEQLLNASVLRVFARAEKPVAIRDSAFPRLQEIRITLDGAELRPDPPPPPRVHGGGIPALQTAELHLQAHEVQVGPATANVRLAARDVAFDQVADANGYLVLVLKRAADGEIVVSADQRAIEQAIAAVAKREAGRHGVTIEAVTLSLHARGDRNIDAEVRVQAKKLFFSTTVRIAAKLDLDDQLNARLSGLACKGEGAIGAMACGFLQPHLAKLEGRSFSLMALPLGEIRLRDVRLVIADRLTVRAEFGA